MASIFTCMTEFSVEQLLVFGAVFLTTYFLYRRHNVSDSGRKLPPAMPSLPIVGSLPFFPTTMEDLAEFCISPRNKLGKIFSFRLGPKFFVLLCGKKPIHEALITKSLDFADRPELSTFSTLNPNSKGISFAHYDSTFKSNRKLCLSILKQFGFGRQVMESRILMEVEEMVKKVREKQGRPFDTRQLTTSCVANIMMSMLFGHRFDHCDPSFQQLITDIRFMNANLSMVLELFPALRFLPYFKKLTAEMLTTVRRMYSFARNNIAACSQSETNAESFVSYFIEAHGQDCDQEQLMYTVVDLLDAGLETSSTFIRWATVVLTNHVSVQERLHTEIDTVIGRERLPTLDDQSNLPFVEATILELHRYKTLVLFAVPHQTLKDTEVDGYFVPAGTTVMVNLHSVHMDPDDWDQPQQFRPERFLDESGNVIGKDRIIPFSLGKRSCLGEQLARQELFLFLVALLQNFNFKPPEGQDSIDERGTWAAINAPRDFEVRMIEREA